LIFPKPKRVISLSSEKRRGRKPQILKNRRFVLLSAQKGELISQKQTKGKDQLPRKEKGGMVETP
jgi:hypothetical protein